MPTPDQVAQGCHETAPRCDVSIWPAQREAIVLYTGGRGHAHYFEFFVYGCKSVRPYLAPLRSEERVGFVQSPLFADMVGLPDEKAYRDACKSLLADSRETKLPVAIPIGSDLPGQGQRPELQRVRAFVGEIAVERGYVIPAPGAKAAIFVPSSAPRGGRSGDLTSGSAAEDDGISELLATAADPAVTTIYAPTPAALAATADGVASVEAALADRGAALLYSTDPEPMALRTAVEDSPSAALVLKVLRARRWRVEVQPASRAADLADRARISARRREADQRIELYVPAGLRALEMVRRLCHELLRIEGCPRLVAADLSEEESRALAALDGVLADDLLRRRFGERLLSLRLGAYEWALDESRVRRAMVRLVEIAAAVAEIRLRPEGYDVPTLLERARRLSPAGVALGERASATIRGVADPTDNLSIALALADLRGEVPLPDVRVDDGRGGQIPARA